MRISCSHIILLGLSLLITSCAKEVTQEELIDAAVVLKLEQWKENQLTTCKEAALTKAENYVDSILLVTSLEDKLDTIPKPTKPTRPFKPTFKEKPDSVIVDPIYKKEE